MAGRRKLEFKHHHGGISVPDLEASIRWYADVLGFEVETRIYIEAVPAKVAMLRHGELRLELFEVEGAAPLPPDRREPNKDLRTHGNKHIAFAVKDVDSFAEQLRKRGADIVFVGHFEFGSNIFIRDNAGNLIEFVQA
ncbi:MAG TPA: VOC family protein [Steroidobacteraceae bacterium]|nr:VOC family protein [Steroidobacteraceae bacterium]